MFIRQPNPTELRLKKGYAIFPVTARNGTVWLCKYRLLQSYCWQSHSWINEHIEEVEQ